MSAIDLKVEGRKGNQEQVAEKYEADEILEQASQMDMEVLRAAEVVAESRDVATAPQSEVVAQAEDIAKKYPSDRQRATLAKARAAKAEKRKARELHGHQAAQGTPAPDLINQVSALLNSKFDNVNKQLDDLKRYLPYESPSQTNHVQDTVTVKPVELESASQIHQMQSTHADNRVPVLLPSQQQPIHAPVHDLEVTPPTQVQTRYQEESYPQKRVRSNYDTLRDAKRNTSMFTKAMSQVNFNSDEVSQRAKINFDSQGGLPPLRPEGIFF